LLLVAGPALLVTRLSGIEATHPVFPKPGLIMGIMTTETVIISFWNFDSFISGKALLQVVHDIIMAGKALIHAKKIVQFFGDICGVRVEPLFSNVFMTVLAGDLAMGGDMKLPGINQPRGLGFSTTQHDGGQNQ
jgi:hypothetical protein